MTTKKLKYYIGFGIFLKVGGLILFNKYDDSSTLMALAYALLLMCFLALRPLKKTSSFL